MHKIGVVGLGFVGTACETAFQNISEVRCHDKFKDTESLASVVKNSDILFLALPTPMAEDGSCDTSIVEDVVEQINKIAKKRKVIVIKSTVPPGTTKKLSERYKKHAILFNPEFLTEKNFINDFLEQDRIILGTTEGCTTEDVLKVIRLYTDFIKTQKVHGIIYEVMSEVAEMLKYATNSFLATKVIFFNEIYEICKASNIDFNEVTGMMMIDKRIGKTHLAVPGHDGQLGFGGKCFPVNISVFISYAKNLGVDPLVLESVWTKNLLVRDEHDWEKISGVTGIYKKNE